MTAAGLILLWPCGRSRLRAGLLVLLLAVIASVANTGCTSVQVGSTSMDTTGGGSGTGGTPAGSMNFTITTAGTSISSSGTYTVRQSTSYLVTTQ
jgi:hypothetical protein